MGFLSKLWSRWFLPRKNAKLAISLADFVQALKMSAFVEKGLGDEIIETWNQDRSLDNFNPRDLGFAQHTIYYLSNLIFESCLANDVNDGMEAFDVVIHVLRDSLNIEVEEAEAAALIGLRWRSAMMTGQWSAEVLDYEPTDHEREIFKASGETAQRIAGLAGIVEPTDAEGKYFASLCASLEPEK